MQIEQANTKHFFVVNSRKKRIVAFCVEDVFSVKPLKFSIQLLDKSRYH